MSVSANIADVQGLAAFWKAVSCSTRNVANAINNPATGLAVM